MKTASKLTLVALLLATPMALTGAAVAQEDEARSGPAIIQVAPAAEQGDAVPVFRGSAIRPVQQNLPSKVIPEGGLETVAGDRLWIVDRKAGEITGCYLKATIRVGALKEIRCTTERLP